MLEVVGKVIVALLKTPFMTAIKIKPFMLVIDAVITTLLRPARGDSIDRVGVEKT